LDFQIKTLEILIDICQIFPATSSIPVGLGSVQFNL